MDPDQHLQAMPILDKVLIGADESGNTDARVKVRLSLAQALCDVKENFVDAEQHFRKALVLVPVDNMELRHNVLLGLGDMLLLSGDIDEAQATINVSLGIARQSGNKDDLAGSLISLSLLERALGLPDNAVARLDEAIDLLLQQALSVAGDEKKQNANTLAVCYKGKRRYVSKKSPFQGFIWRDLQGCFHPTCQWTISLM